MRENSGERVGSRHRRFVESVDRENNIVGAEDLHTRNACMHMQQDQKRSCFLASRCFSLLFVSNPLVLFFLSFSLADYPCANVSTYISWSCYIRALLYVLFLLPYLQPIRKNSRDQRTYRYLTSCFYCVDIFSSFINTRLSYVLTDFHAKDLTSEGNLFEKNETS